MSEPTEDDRKRARARKLFNKTKRACAELQRLGGTLVCVDEVQARGIAERFEGKACSAADHPDGKTFKPGSGIWLVDFAQQGELELGEAP